MCAKYSASGFVLFRGFRIENSAYRVSVRSKSDIGKFILEKNNAAYTGCNRRNRPDFGRVFLRSYYTDITQNTYIQS